MEAFMNDCGVDASKRQKCEEDLMSMMRTISKDTAEEVINLMITHKIIRVPVVRDGRLLGIISRTDILDHMVDSHLINIYGT